MLKIIAILLGLVVAHRAAPVDCEKGSKGVTESVFGGKITPWIPFPHFDDLALYKFADLVLLPGSAFVIAKPDGSCHRVLLDDDEGGYCPLNQTVCDQIRATRCSAEVANATCFQAPEPGQTPAPGQPTDVPDGEFGNGYPFGGPLCFVEVLGHKVQPSSYTAIFTLQPNITTCVFSVAPPPTICPDPTGIPTPSPQDPNCPYVKM